MDIEVLLTEIPFRYYFLGMHFVIAFVAFQLSGRFLINSLPNFRSTSGKINLAFSQLFICMGFVFVFKIIYFFYWHDIFDYEKYVYITIASGTFVAILLTENIIRKNYFFTIISGLVVGLLFVVPLTSFLIYFVFGLFFLVLIYPFQYMQHLIRISGGKVKRKFIELFVSACLIAIGAIMNVEDRKSVV